MDDSQSADEIVAEFKRRQKRQLIATIPLLIAMPIVVVGTQTQGPTVFGMPSILAAKIGVVLFVGSIGYTLKNWRCPKCSRYLGRAIAPASCPSCGARLRRS